MNRFALSFLLLFIFAGRMQGQIITTFAGTGATGYTGDGGPATNAQLNVPYDVAIDAAGNIYFVEELNNIIRKVNTSGITSTVAGSGSTGFSGDGGPATAATFFQPTAVAIDGIGNLYIADKYNNRIRKVDTAGMITTIAGTGIFGFGGDGGPATAAQFASPGGLNVDAAGNVFVADAGNNRIRKIAPGGTVTTVAGNGTGGFAGDGSAATMANLFSPNSVCVDAAGNLYISDGSNQRIRKVNTAGIISTFAGNGVGGYGGDAGPATLCQLLNPDGIETDNLGNIYIADASNHRIRKIDTSGFIVTVAGTGSGMFGGDGGPAVVAQLYSPTGLAVDYAGNIFIADLGNDRVRKVVSPLGPITGPSSVCTGDTVSFADATPGGFWISKDTIVARVDSFTGKVVGIVPGIDTIRYLALGRSVYKVITVNPTPWLTSSLFPTSTCNNTLFKYKPTSADSNTNYAWTRAFVPGIANPAASGIDSINESLIATTFFPDTVVYVYTLSLHGCVNTQRVTLVVFPGPVLTSSLIAPTVCDSSVFHYIPTCAIPGTLFTWVRPAVAGISNSYAWGGFDPAERLDNTTSSPVQVTYYFTLTKDGCSNMQQVKVVVDTCSRLAVNSVACSSGYLKIYPNPGSGIFNIELPQGQNIASVSVRDVLGNVILNRTLDNNSTALQQFDLNDFATGVYYVRALGRDRSFTATLVKK